MEHSENDEQQSHWSLRKVVLVLWFCAWVTLAVLVYVPQSYGIFRLSIALSLIAIAAGALYLIWDKRPLRYAFITVISAWVCLFLLPGSAQTNEEQLRKRYTNALRTFSDTTYVWGGETPWGIDCSGLVRQGWLRANLVHGLATLNGRLLRESLYLWWFDASARALKAGYRNRTKVLFRVKSINSLDHRKLLPGDFAITADGLHALAYLGKRKWIEADPDEKKVLIVNVPSKGNIWFHKYVYIVRWKSLQGQ